MTSGKTVGAAPVVTGILLAFQSAGTVVQDGFSLWAVSSLVGGCAAILVGLGILLERETFEVEPTESNRPSVAVLGFAAVAFFVGVVVAVA